MNNDDFLSGGSGDVNAPGFGRTGGSFSYNYFDELDKEKFERKAVSSKKSRFKRDGAKQKAERAPGAHRINLGKLEPIRGEMKKAALFVLATQGVQVVAFLVYTYVFPAHSVVMPMFLVSIFTLVVFLILDSRLAKGGGADLMAFRVISGLFWLVFALILSLIGLFGGMIFSCAGKKNCTSDYTFTILKTYAAMTVLQGVVLGIIIAIALVMRKRRAIEARKTVSIHISKPKINGA